MGVDVRDAAGIYAAIDAQNARVFWRDFILVRQIVKVKSKSNQAHKSTKTH
jgi:hypothetical protein